MHFLVMNCLIFLGSLPAPVSALIATGILIPAPRSWAMIRCGTVMPSKIQDLRGVWKFWPVLLFIGTLLLAFPAHHYLPISRMRKTLDREWWAPIQQVQDDLRSRAGSPFRSFIATYGDPETYLPLPNNEAIYTVRPSRSIPAGLTWWQEAILHSPMRVHTSGGMITAIEPWPSPR